MATAQPTATKLMIIRHAEKPSSQLPPFGVTADGQQDAESLIVRGWQRAGALVPFFSSPQNAAIAPPQFIFASQIKATAAEPQLGSKSERAQASVTPLIDKLGSKVTVNFTFAKGAETDLADAAIACAGIVLICWEHQSILTITKQLPVNSSTPVPTTWPVDSQGHSRFDLVWVFTLDQPSATYKFSQVAQLLLAGDSPT